MDRLIFTLLSIYFFLSCLPALATISTENTVLPFFAMVIVFLWWAYFCVSDKVHLSKIDGYLGLYIFVIMIPLILYPGTPLEDWISWGTSIQIAFIFVVTRTIINDQKRLNFALFMLVVGIFVLSTLTIMEHFNIISLGTEVKKTTIEGELILRHESLAGGINRSALYFGIGTLLSVGLLLEKRSFTTKVLLIVVILFSSVANLFTYSVGGFIALAMGFFILFSSGILLRNIVFRRFTLVSIGVTVLLLLITFNPRLTAKYDQIRNENYMHWGSNRVATYLGAVKSISEYPLVGAGPTKFVKNISDYYPFFHRGDTVAAHNTYLSVAGETGLVGFLFFILFLVNVVLSSWRHSRFSQSFVSQILFACLGMALVMSLSFDSQRDKLFWIVSALTAATLNLSPKTGQTAGR